MIKAVDYTLANRLEKLGYKGPYKYSYVVCPDEPVKCYEVMPFAHYPDGTKFLPAPRLDDVIYWLADNFGVIINITTIKLEKLNDKLCFIARVADTDISVIQSNRSCVLECILPPTLDLIENNILN